MSVLLLFRNIFSVLANIKTKLNFPNILNTYIKQIWGAPKSLGDGDCSHKIKRHSLEEKLCPT